MTTPDTPNKDKSKGRAGRSFPVTFVVDQQLEACVLAIKQNSRPSVLQAEVVDTNAADSAGFSALLFDNGVAVTHVHGTLRRWQGTSTRLEGHAEHVGNNETASFGCLAVLVLALIFAVVAPLTNVASNEAEAFGLTLDTLVFFILLVAVFFVGRGYYNNYRLVERLRKLFQAL